MVEARQGGSKLDFADAEQLWTRAEPARLLSTTCSHRSCLPPRQLNRSPSVLGGCVLLDTLKVSVVPQFFPASWLEDIPIVFLDFPSRIRIGYVLRREGAYSYVLRDDLQRLGITVPELHGFAVENLSALPSGRMTFAGPPGGSEGFIAADDNFAAARILLPEARTMLASRLGDPFLVTLPHRDSCFCWSLTQPPERQARHAAEALEGFINDDYCLFSMYKEQRPGEQHGAPEPRPRGF